MRTRQPIVLRELLEGRVAEPETVASPVDVDAARERLATQQAEHEQHVRQARREVITDATEVIDELHQIVETNIEADDEISPLTEQLIRDTAERALRRAGEDVEVSEVSMESYITPKQRVLLSLESLNEVKEKLSAEAESLSESEPEPSEPPAETA